MCGHHGVRAPRATQEMPFYSDQTRIKRPESVLGCAGALATSVTCCLTDARSKHGGSFSGCCSFCFGVCVAWPAKPTAQRARTEHRRTRHRRLTDARRCAEPHPPRESARHTSPYPKSSQLASPSRHVSPPPHIHRQTETRNTHTHTHTPCTTHRRTRLGCRAERYRSVQIGPDQLTREAEGQQGTGKGGKESRGGCRLARGKRHAHQTSSFSWPISFSSLQ